MLDVIIYKQETEEIRDEKMDWRIITSEKQNLTWDGEKLLPENYNKSNE